MCESQRAFDEIKQNLVKIQGQNTACPQEAAKCNYDFLCQENTVPQIFFQYTLIRHNTKLQQHQVKQSSYEIKPEQFMLNALWCVGFKAVERSSPQSAVSSVSGESPKPSLARSPDPRRAMDTVFRRMSFGLKQRDHSLQDQTVLTPGSDGTDVQKVNTVWTSGF